MKKLLLFLLLFSSYYSQGQNYACLQAGVKRYFTNSYGYLRGMRIDSVRTSGSDTIYYPFHTARGSYLSSTTLDSTGGSWLGKKVVQQDDGTFLFDNIFHDTTVIKTNAHTGDSWIFYTDTTLRYYRATVTSSDTLTTAGFFDSVKIITIYAFDDTGAVPSDPTNNFRIILSKNNGFVQVFDLYTFPYHNPDANYVDGMDYYFDAATEGETNIPGAVFSRVDFLNPNNTQLFDWSIGDIFERSRCNITLPGTCRYPYQFYFDSITTKNVFADSIQYGTVGWCATQHCLWFDYEPDTFYPYDTVNRPATFTIPSTLLFDTTLMPEEFNQKFLINYFPNDTDYCLHGNKYVTNPSEIIGSHWVPIHFESWGPTTTYKMGLGLVHYFFSTMGHPTEEVEDTTQKYYKRSGSSCGTYFNPPRNSVNLLGKTRQFNLFPNPATTELTIRTNNTLPHTITLLNTIGQTITTLHSSKQEETIDVSDIPAALYLITVTDDNGNRYSEKIVIRH